MRSTFHLSRSTFHLLRSSRLLRSTLFPSFKTPTNHGSNAQNDTDTENNRVADKANQQYDQRHGQPKRPVTLLRTRRLLLRRLRDTPFLRCPLTLILLLRHTRSLFCFLQVPFDPAYVNGSRSSNQRYPDSSCHRMGGGCVQLALSRNCNAPAVKWYPIPVCAHPTDHCPPVHHCAAK